MACFVVPAAEAVIATVAVQIAKKHEISQEKLECKLPEGAVQAPEYKVSASRKLSWLRNLLWGGVLLLAFEHLWHGELTGQKRFRLYIDMGNMRKRIFDALFLMLLFFFVRYVLKSAAAA